MADEWTAKLDTYLDGELKSEEWKALDTHLRGCPTCASDVAAKLQLKRSVQSAGRRYTPSAELRQRIQRQIGSRPSRIHWRGWLVATATLAVLLIAGLVTTHFRQEQMARLQTFGELVDLHVAALASSNPVDVVSTDRHTVKPWFEGKLPFSFNLPELQNTEFSLAGGRVSYLGQAPGAELIYHLRSHQISVFIFQDAAVGRSLPSNSGAQKQVAFTVDTWSHDGLRYFVLGDPGAEDIGKLADLFKKAAGG